MKKYIVFVVAIFCAPSASANNFVKSIGAGSAAAAVITTFAFEVQYQRFLKKNKKNPRFVSLSRAEYTSYLMHEVGMKKLSAEAPILTEGLAAGFLGGSAIGLMCYSHLSKHSVDALSGIGTDMTKKTESAETDPESKKPNPDDSKTPEKDDSETPEKERKRDSADAQEKEVTLASIDEELALLDREIEQKKNFTTRTEMLEYEISIAKKQKLVLEREVLRKKQLNQVRTEDIEAKEAQLTALERQRALREKQDRLEQIALVQREIVLLKSLEAIKQARTAREAQVAAGNPAPAATQPTRVVDQSITYEQDKDQQLQEFMTGWEQEARTNNPNFDALSQDQQAQLIFQEGLATMERMRPDIEAYREYAEQHGTPQEKNEAQVAIQNLERMMQHIRSGTRGDDFDRVAMALEVQVRKDFEAERTAALATS